MPGITGIIAKTFSEKNRQDLDSMINSMLHESSYSSGKYINNQTGLYAGWVCHKDSFCDCLPIWNEKRDAVLIFFGENFTDPDLFNQLKSKNHTFNNTDASYLIHMYEEKGVDFLRDLNGWYSGLIVDLQTNRTVLFNDRYGMQKIFYHEGKDAFYFASEAKALLEVCPTLRELGMKDLGELVGCGCVLENRTLFKNVFLFPTGSAWKFQNNTIKKETYFNPSDWENQDQLEKELFYKKLKETFVHILPRYFNSRHNIAISLTGGLDTRMIMANASMPAGKYPCFTFDGMYRDCYDVTISKKVAKTCNQTHQIVYLDRNFLNNFAQYAAKTIYITDGYLDVSGAPEIYVNKLAREIAPIRLTGNFGGEVMRNISHLKATAANERLFQPEFNKQVKSTKDTLGKIKRNVPLSFILFNDAPWYNNNRFISEQSQLTLRTPFLDNDLTALMYRAPLDTINSENASLRLIKDGNPKLGEILTDRGVGLSNSQFSSLVHLYREFLFKAEYAYNYGMPQWLARFDYTFKFMHFEKLFLGRHKFYHFRLWYRNELAEYVKAILLDDRSLNRPYLNRKAVEDVVEGHTKGYRNYTIEINQLLTLELIQRLLIEKTD